MHIVIALVNTERFVRYSRPNSIMCIGLFLCTFFNSTNSLHRLFRKFPYIYIYIYTVYVYVCIYILIIWICLYHVCLYVYIYTTINSTTNNTNNIVQSFPQNVLCYLITPMVVFGHVDDLVVQYRTVCARGYNLLYLISYSYILITNLLVS